MLSLYYTCYLHTLPVKFYLFLILTLNELEQTFLVTESLY